MDRTFKNMFIDNADDTSNGYYFYNVEDEPCETDPFDELKGKDAWNCRKPKEVFGITADLEKVLSRIANENKPFLEISCGNYMGLTPFILKRNPEIQCLVTDIDDTIINGWQEFIDNPLNGLQRYNISLARFDNCDMPIKGGSFDYVTCTLALNWLYNKSKDKFNKALKEIHRILKKDGCLVAFEHTMNMAFDMTRIYHECQPGGTLYGIYSYEEMKKLQKEFQEEKIQFDQFLLTGFKKELKIDSKNIKKYTYKEAFCKIHIKANKKSNTFGNSRERYDRIKKLKEETPCFGVKYTLEKYFFVLRKI